MPSNVIMDLCLGDFGSGCSFAFVLSIPLFDRVFNYFLLAIIVESNYSEERTTKQAYFFFAGTMKKPLLALKQEGD